MKLVWTRLAQSDRRTIRNYIAKDNPAAAIALDLAFSEKASRLCQHPAIGRIGRVPETRELVVHPNYILVYDLAPETVRVLRILHAARLWPPE